MPDAPGRVERVLNLLALLLDTRVPLTRDELVARGQPATPTQSAREPPRVRARQGDAARLGVPITMETIGDGGEVGYRVRPDDYYLPDLGLDGRRDRGAARRGERGLARRTRQAKARSMKLGGVGDEAAAPIASLPIAPGAGDAVRRVPAPRAS